MNPADNIAVLTGNGTSIDFNSKLALPHLTKRITQKLGPSAAQYLLHASSAFGSVDANDFEALLGPLDTWGKHLGRLGDMGDLAPLIPRQRSFLEATQEVQRGLASVGRYGLSHALEVIDSYSYADWGSRAPLVRFMKELEAAASPGLLRLANLNYDAVNLAVMHEVFNYDLCDMARGQRTPLRVVPGHARVQGFPIRTQSDLFPNRHQLVHLHGSTGWLRDPDGAVWKVGIQDVRQMEFWKAYREERTEWTPVVVLTNQARKSAVVREEPFQLAYQVFGEALRTSSRWLVVGYSFRDEAVNDLLAREYQEHLDPPTLLIVTKGSDLSEDAVRDALHLPRRRPVTILRNGLRNAPASPEWSAWAARLPVLHSAA